MTNRNTKDPRVAQPRRIRLLLAMVFGLAISLAHAADPAAAIAYDIPGGALDDALNRFALRSGVLLSFDPQITQGKITSGLKGSHPLNAGFATLLQGTGLEVVPDAKGSYQLRRRALPLPEKTEKPQPKSITTGAVNVRAQRFHEIGPLPGLGLTKDEIPGNVQSITAQEIKEAHSLSLTDLMNKKLQSVNVNDYQGNPFQMDVTYRGFTAGPQIGTPQGLSVFFDGIRVNEPFGDVVNWDMIPMNAISSFDVFPGSNPIFGLGTLGGALTVKTKDGFKNAGFDAEVLTGSFGRKQLQVEGGINNANQEEGSWDAGSFALYGAGNFFLEDGWRQNSPSKVNQAFGKASYRGAKLDLSLSTLLVQTDLVGNGVVPTDMYAQDRTSNFTSPDTTKNRLAQFQLSGSYFVNDGFTITGQIYRRNSKRKQKNADVYTEYGSQTLNRNLANGEQYTCLFKSTNDYNLPDYYVIDLPNADLSQNEFIVDWFAHANDSGFTLNTGLANGDPANPDTKSVAASFNQKLPDFFRIPAQQGFNYYKTPYESLFYDADYASGLTANAVGEMTTYSNGEASHSINLAGATFGNYFGVSGDHTVVGGPKSGFSFFNGSAYSYYYTPDGTKHVVAFLEATNGEKCNDLQLSNPVGAPGSYLGVIDPVTGLPQVVNGLADIDTGVVEGTPTAVITDNTIDQKVDGGSIQFNWNLERHKLMVGASIDKAYAEYANAQRLGFFDSKRNGFLAPDLARDQYAVADIEVRNNDFDGTSLTKSVYASETWSPVDSWHFTGAMRYNDTHVRNTLAARAFGETAINLSAFANNPYFYDICPNGNCNGVPTGARPPDLSRVMHKPETEKFSYHSLNPSFGATWQAKENLNLYGNWAQGTRTPSVIELGCALDKTPYEVGRVDNKPIYQPISVAEGRSCQLPSGLSGDPYLPQVKAQTLDLGMRGRWADAIEWNFGYYRTDIKDDIYMVTYNGNQNFFDSIGKTHRQGLEMGMNGELGKARFGLNYALTDAKFGSTFQTAGANNSSASPMVMVNGDVIPGTITVNPGDRMPGVPLHNLNASVSYDITPDWTIGLSAVMHSWSYLRGNENNQHQPGIASAVIVPDFVPNGSGGFKYQGFKTVFRQPSTNPGKVPGYTVFNFQTSYKFNKEWTATLLVNNVFDKEYFSAGRLGVNPFSPSIHGAIGPDGYNHNSNDWLSTNFIAPGAPRAAWIGLRYEFSPDGK